MKNSKERAAFELMKAQAKGLLEQISADVDKIGTQSPNEAVVTLHHLELAANEFARMSDALMEYQYQQQLEQIGFTTRLDRWQRQYFISETKCTKHLGSCVKLVEKYLFVPERYAEVQRKFEAYKEAWAGITGEPSVRDIGVLIKLATNIIEELLRHVNLIESRATRLELLTELAGLFTE